MTITHDTACPKCREMGRDKTGNHLMFFEDGGFFCNRCGYKSGRGETTPQYSKIGLDEINQLPSRALRDISGIVREKYGVKTAVSEEDGTTVTDVYYPRYRDNTLTGYKVRQLPKRFSGVGDIKKSDLWGKHVFAPTKTLIITEGEEDAMAVWQSIVDNSPEKFHKLRAVCSLANGSNSIASQLHDNLEYIDQFEEVIFCLDNDGAGQESLTEALKYLPKGKVATLSQKDANDMLLNGKSRELFEAVVFKAKERRPDGVVSVADVWEKAIQPIEWGLSYPWQTITDITYGIRRKELLGFGAGTGGGKTEAFKEMIQHLLYHHELPVALFFLEEEPALTAKVIAGKLANKRFHIPDSGWTVEELEEAMMPIKDTCWMYDHQGTKDWDSIKGYIRYYVTVLGIKDIFLDNLTALVSDVEDVNAELSRIMAEMSGIAEELDFTLYFISHLNTPANGKTPHEEGGRVTMSNFRGSRTIGFWSNYVFGLERNQQAEDETERNTTTMRVLKDRYTGLATGRTVKLFYDHDTGRMKETSDMFEEVF